MGNSEEIRNTSDELGTYKEARCMNGVPTAEVEMRALRRTQPQHTTARLPFLAGSAGNFLAAAASIALWSVASRSDLFIYYAHSDGLILSTLFAIMLLLASFGFFGIWRNYASKIGACAFGLGLVASLFLLISGFVASGACAYRAEDHVCYRSLPYPYSASVAVSYILMGIAFIADGYTFLKIQRFAHMPENATTTGVLYIVAGCLFASILGGQFFGFFVLMVTFIFGGITLARAPIFPSSIVKVAPPTPPAEV
jgi:hypothetical protein